MKKFDLGIILIACMLSLSIMASAQAPEVTDLTIAASSPSNLTNDDLESSYTLSGTVVETAENWLVDGMSVTNVYLPFEGGSQNALLDFSGHNNNAAYSANGSQRPAWSQDLGYNGHGVFVFDGVDDYLEIVDGLPQNSDYTKTAWIYATGPGTTFRNIISADFYGENNHTLKIDPDGILNAGHSFGSRVVASPDSLHQDEWYFVAVSFDFESGEMVLYLDGQEIDRGFVPAAYRSVAYPTVRVGCMGTISYFEGRIDEPRIYNRALSGEQILSLFNDGNGILKAPETQGSDSWEVAVTPFSISEVGNTLVSNSIDILGPQISGLNLAATSPSNLTIDDLESSYASNSSVVETAENWLVDGASVTKVYLPFEGGSQNALLDFSGNDNHAEYSIISSQRPAWSPDLGHNGHGVFVFDGDDFLNIEDGLPQNADYTKTAWIYATGPGTTFRNILSADFYGENNHTLKVDPDGILNAGHSFGSRVVSSPDSLHQDEWYFVAVSFEFESGEMVLYVNGEEVDRNAVPEAYRSVADPTVRVGCMGALSFFQGRIDEPRIYNRALSGPQIMSLFNDGNGILKASETYDSENWQVEVTPFSIYEVGNTTVSNSIEILGPQISGLSLTASSPSNLTIDDLTASYTENESVTETAVAWYKNGSPDAVLYLPMEGGPHNSLLDFSGNNNHVVLDPAAGSQVPDWHTNYGIGGSGGYYFDGYGDMLDGGDVMPLNSDYSKTAWVFINGSNDTYRNIISADIYAPQNHFLHVETNGRLGAGQNSGIHTVLDPDPMNTAEWYLVGVTFEYETGEMILYKNGVEVARGTVPLSDRSIADPNVQIGAMAGGANWLGRMDEPRLYAHVLSPEQMQEMYANGKNGLMSQETHGSDEWHVEVTPFANYEVGNTYTSNTLTIHSTFVSEIPDQTVSEGSSFTNINLNDYVDDYEYNDNDMVWSTHGESGLLVSISSSNVATISGPDNDWYGSENIYFVARNPYGDADSTEVTFTVQNINDAPVLVNIGGQITSEDTPLVGRIVDFTDVDPTDNHTITVVSSNPNVTIANKSGDTSGSTYDLVPSENWNGSTQITVTVTDNGSGALSDFEEYTLIVNPVNDAPVLTDIGDQETDEETRLTGLSVVFTDVDASDQHTITVNSDNSNISVQNLTGHINGSQYELVPATDWNGTAQITVRVTDNGTGALSDSETYTLTVHPVNDAPVLTEIGDQSTDEDTDLADLPVSFSDVDASDAHTITVVSSETAVTVANLSGHSSGSTYDLVPAADWNGTAQITVTVTDNGTGALSDSEVYTLTVNAVDDAPRYEAIGDQFVDEDEVLRNLPVIFTDPDASDTHTISVTSSVGAVVVANLSGNTSGSSYILIPDRNWYGTAAITVTVTQNGSALFDSETYTLTVNNINDAPDSILISSDEIDEKSVLGTSVGVFSTMDVDSEDTHSYVFATDGGIQDVDNNAFIIDGDTLKTNAEIDYETQDSYSILVQTDDGNGGVKTVHFTIIVNDVDETAVEDFYNHPAFNVYPVPANDYVTVEIDNPENEELLLEIYYATGAIAHTEYIYDKKVVDISGFKDGMYIVRISGEKVYGTRKLIVRER